LLERHFLIRRAQYSLARVHELKDGRQHIEGDKKEPTLGRELKIQTEKSGRQIEVVIPILSPLAEVLAAGPTGELSFICGSTGRPMTKESYGNALSDAARKAAVNKSAHGVREDSSDRRRE
jgi:hypothetical protein